MDVRFLGERQAGPGCCHKSCDAIKHEAVGTSEGAAAKGLAVTTPGELHAGSLQTRKSIFTAFKKTSLDAENSCEVSEKGFSESLQGPASTPSSYKLSLGTFLGKTENTVGKLTEFFLEFRCIEKFWGPRDRRYKKKKTGSQHILATWRLGGSGSREVESKRGKQPAVANK